MTKPRLGTDPFNPSKGVDALIKDTREDPSLRTKPKVNYSKLIKPKAVQGNSSKAGLPLGWTRGAFVIREELLEQVKAFAWADRREIKVIVDEALSRFLKGKLSSKLLKDYKNYLKTKTIKQ